MAKHKFIWIPAFYSSSKKPSMRPLVLLTIAAVLTMAGCFIGGMEKYSAVASLVMAIYALCASIWLFIAFRRQIKYDPYTHNTIFFIGFGLFGVSVALTYLLLFVDIVSQPDVYRGLMVISTILGSAKTFMFFSFPFLFVFSIALCVSNISLIRHEGKRIVNLLGIVLSFLLVGGCVFLYAVDYMASGSWFEVMMHDMLTNLLAAIYLYFECMLIGAIICGAIAAKHEPAMDLDYVIILGCGIRRDGTPTPLLRGRIDRAIRFAKAQQEATGKELIFVTSGGQGSDEIISESTSMKRYLMEQGIPEERILEEDKSTNTLENMQFSKEKILAQNPNAKIGFSTNNYHVFRSGYFASAAGMKAEGMGAKTKWYFWPNAAVREFIGLLTKQKGRQILIVGSMIAFYLILTVVAYVE